MQKIEVILFIVFLQGRDKGTPIQYGRSYQAGNKNILPPDTEITDTQPEIERVFSQDNQNYQYREDGIKKKGAEVAVLDDMVVI
jgi:hypothetical protein